jgi:hypothetical protein
MWLFLNRGAVRRKILASQPYAPAVRYSPETLFFCLFFVVVIFFVFTI